MVKSNRSYSLFHLLIPWSQWVIRVETYRFVKYCDICSVFLSLMREMNILKVTKSWQYSLWWSQFWTHKTYSTVIFPYSPPSCAAIASVPSNLFISQLKEFLNVESKYGRLSPVWIMLCCLQSTCICIAVHVSYTYRSKKGWDLACETETDVDWKCEASHNMNRNYATFFQLFSVYFFCQLPCYLFRHWSVVGRECWKQYVTIARMYVSVCSSPCDK